MKKKFYMFPVLPRRGAASDYAVVHAKVRADENMLPNIGIEPGEASP
jgi:hypothetical protein